MKSEFAEGFLVGWIVILIVAGCYAAYMNRCHSSPAIGQWPEESWQGAPAVTPPPELPEWFPWSPPRTIEARKVEK
jgi:hypothetical protein